MVTEASKRLLTLLLVGVSSFASKPPSLDYQLLAHNVELTEPALLKALTNSDPEIRVLAGQKLVDTGDSLAITSVENALAVEKESNTRVSLASALASITDKKGFESLLSACSDESLESSSRARAAVELAKFRNLSCLGTVLEITKTNDRTA